MADIIILAIISVILGIKLFTILGQKRDQDTNRESLSNVNKHSQMKEAQINLTEKLPPKAKLKLMDPSFDDNVFLKNAQSAFKLILSCYAEGDTHTLSKLINVEMMKKFAYEISKREDNNTICSIEIVNITKNLIKDIIVENYQASITVNFQAEIINFVKDKDNKIISGNKTKLSKESHKWTFTRDLRSPDPTWHLTNIDKLFS